MKTIILLLLCLISFNSFAQATEKCKAITKAGTQCTRNAVLDGYCKQHYLMVMQSKKVAAPFKNIIVFDKSVRTDDLNSSDVFRIYSRKGDTLVLGYYY